MKQYLIYAGMFVACFLVINVGMYFFLDFTQPVHEMTANEGADSTHVVGDSVSVHKIAAVDSIAAPESTLEHRTPVLAGLGGEVTDSEDTTAVAETISSKNETPVVANETAGLHESATDPSASLAYDESDYDTPAVEPDGISEEALSDPNPKELAKLAKLLEGMKPAEAAAIASRLGTEEIVALVMKMKDRKAAKMMAELPVDRAAQVAERMSELIAARN